MRTCFTTDGKGANHFFKMAPPSVPTSDRRSSISIFVSIFAQQLGSSTRVALAGIGSDELLGGYVRLYWGDRLYGATGDCAKFAPMHPLQLLQCTSTMGGGEQDEFALNG